MNNRIIKFMFDKTFQKPTLKLILISKVYRKTFS